MSDLILDQFSRLLDGLDARNPWPGLEESGFLDLLRPEADGGADLALDGLFPLALESGRRADCPPVIETMIARLVRPDASAVRDLNAALIAGGVGSDAARAVCAALAGAQMAGALEAIEAMTLDYANTRKQFGREIGKFQAIQHQIAVMAEETQAARMAAQMAFQGVPLEVSPRRAGVAKIRAGEAAQVCAASAHAVHGAIGVSREHALGGFVARLHRLRLAHGGEAWWSRRLGQWALESRDDCVSLARAV